MNMKRIFKFVLGAVMVTMLLFSCDGVLTAPLITQTESSMVIYGVFIPGRTIELSVSRSFHPIGDIPTDIIIDDALVELYEDDSLVSVLTHNDQEVYSTDRMIVAGKSYYVKVEAVGYKTAYSKKINIPEISPSFDVYVQKDVTGRINPGIPQDLVNITLKDFEPSEDNYFLVSIAAHYNDYIESQTWFLNPAEDEEKDCHVRTGLLMENGYQEAMIFTDKCFLDAEKNVSLFIEKAKYQVDPTSGELGYVLAKEVVVSVIEINEEWFLNARGISEQPWGLDKAWVEPTNASTNIVDGLGFIKSGVMTNYTY